MRGLRHPFMCVEVAELAKNILEIKIKLNLNWSPNYLCVDAIKSVISQ